MDAVQKLQSLVEKSSQETDKLQTQLDEETIRSVVSVRLYVKSKIIEVAIDCGFVVQIFP